MKKQILLWICIGILGFYQSGTQAQWVQTGPVGGWVEDFAVYGNTIYAATYGGVLQSTNGTDWEHTSWGLMEGDIQSVAATSTKIFAGTWGDGIYIKDAAGGIWQHCSQLTNISVQCFAVIGNNVFAGTYSTGVWLSTDNGANWTQVNNGLTGSQVECFAVKGTDIFAGVEGGGVFRSTNNGANWTSANAGLPSDSPISLAVNGNDLYVGLWANGIYTSPNDGQGWLPFGDPVGYPSSFAFNGSDIYVCGRVNGIYLTTNNGGDWTKLVNGIPSTSQIKTISFVGTNLVVGEATVNEGSQGLFVSTNYGTEWSHLNWGLPKYCANGIAVNNGKILDATCGGIYRSTNGGDNWNKPTIHGDYDWADFTAIAFRSNLSGFAGDVNGYSYSTTTGGDDWNAMARIEEGATVTSLAYISTYIFASTKPYMAGVEGGVYMSLDNAESWTRVSNGLPTLADTNTVVTSLAVSGSNLFAGTGHGVYLSTDNGTSWNKVSNGLTGIWVYALAVKGTELFAGTLGQGVFRSNDNGTTWTHTSLVKDVTSFAVVDTNLFVGTWCQGMYRLVNYDSTWKSIGLADMYITSLTADEGYLYAATDYNSVWKRALTEVTDIKESGNIVPGEFALYQNYPNPFNPATIIRYSTGNLQHVTLRVYDILGNEISTLVNEEKPAGTYQVNFEASNLPSGIYFYKIQTGKYTETKKMILIK